MAFVPGDLAKAVLASLIAVAVRKAYPVIEPPARRPSIG
jgi:biotin transport system substrate-specific component